MLYNVYYDKDRCMEDGPVTVTLNIILEALSKYAAEPHAADGNRRFSRVDVPPEGGVLFADRLYVCRLSLALKLTREYPDVVFLCLRDRFNSRDETEELMKNLIVINENIAVTALFSEALDCFMRVAEWRWEMREAAMQNRPMQALLVLSEPVIGNFISVSDSSLALLTYTPGIPTDDPVSLALIKNGYHSEEAVRRFKAHNRFELWEKSDGLIFDLEGITAPYPVVSKVFKYRGTYFTHVVMVCNNRPITPGLLDLFNMLLEALEVYIERDWKQKEEGGSVHDTLITSLLDNTELRTDVIADRAEQAGLPLEASFRLLKLIPMKNPGEPVGIIFQEAQALLPGARAVVYHQSLLILLFSRSGGVSAELALARERLAPLLESRGFCCGISEEFSELKGIRLAFFQATMALSYGGRLMGSAPKSRYGGPFFDYEDYYIHMLLSEHDNTGILAAGRPLKWLRALREYDERHGGDNCGLLYLYLVNERHAGRTAEAAFMSRNNVAYRISRITALLGIDLDDYQTRMKLLATYELLKLNPQL